MTILKIENYSTAEELALAIKEAANSEITLLVNGNQVYVITPAEAAKDEIAERLVKRVIESPAILHDLENRLRNSEPESWD